MIQFLKNIKFDSFWIATTGILTLFIVIFWFIDRRERKRLNGIFLNGKRFLASQLEYSPKFFSGARIDRNTQLPSNYQPRDVENAIKEKIDKGNSLVLLGTPLKGKTRTMVECLKAMKGTDCTIALPSKFEGEIRFPRKKWFCNKHLLILDDLQDFFKDTNNAVRLLDVAFQEGFIIVANCRSSGEWQSVRNSYDTISKRFDIIEISEPTSEEIEGFLKMNNLKEVPDFYDKKNIGTLIIDLDTMRDRYDNAKNYDKKILLCIKELYYLDILDEKGEIENNKIKILAEKAHNLTTTDDELNTSIQWCIDNDFVMAKNRGINPETVYLNQIIEPDYPVIDMIESGLRASLDKEINFSGLIYSAPSPAKAREVFDFMKKIKIRPSVSEYNELIAKQQYYSNASDIYNELINDQIKPDKQTFYTLLNIYVPEQLKINEGEISFFEKAIETFIEASNNNHEDSSLYIYWGLVLQNLAMAKGSDILLLEEACKKYEQAAVIKKDEISALNNWGNALFELAIAKGRNIILFEEACQKYEQATMVKKESYTAFNNWGTGLFEIAKARHGDLTYFKEACKKYEQAAFIKSDYFIAFKNWGDALTEIAKVSGNDIALFNDAGKKYKHAIKLKKDFYQALMSWAVVLEAMARMKENDMVLFEEACKKYEDAAVLKPDNPVIFYKWGLLLHEMAIINNADLALFNAACEKFERVTIIEPNNEAGFFQWGYALQQVAKAKDHDELLLSEACRKYENAISIKPDYYKAFYNLGIALGELANIKGKDLQLLNEACKKYEQAARIEPDNSEAFDSWGFTLFCIACAKGDDIDLFGNACEKYERCTLLEPNNFQAFYNWGEILIKMALIKGDDKILSDAAKEKKIIAHKLRPDLIDEKGKMK